MKKKYLIILLLTMILMPFKVFAAGGFGVSTTSISMYLGESKTITISTNNAVGKLNISSSNGGVASASPSSIFIQNPGSTGSITITGNSVGTATISVVASSDFATMDEEILAGQTKTITVNVISKPAPEPSNPTPLNPTPSNPKPSSPQPTQPQNNLSKNNNLKTLSVEGYELVKVDNNNYTLTVTNDVISINVNATAEDSKAKVSGTGVKKLQVGENNIEVIVTSESGVQNKFTIKVTRKDGYYLEDLDSVLKNEKLQDADIIINANSKITKEQLNQIKNSKKTLRFNYYDENKKLIYSWVIDGKKVAKSIDISTNITFDSENSNKILQASNYSDGIILNFEHKGLLPIGTKIKVNVAEKYKDGELVNIYYYNNENNKVEEKNKQVKVENGFIKFEIEHCSEYFVTLANINNNFNSNMFIIISIIELLVIVSIILLDILKINPLLKIKKDTKKNT